MKAALSQRKGFRWGVERRLELIEFRLFWEGGVNRSDIVDEFGVSVPQASKDLALYQDQAPQNLRYDRSQKRYFAAKRFRPKFIDLNAAAYLEKLAGQHAEGAGDVVATALAPIADTLPLPRRNIDPDILRAILSVVREGRSLEIIYQSMSEQRPEPVWRRISPHAFASDGLRWHVRAYCHQDKKFKDFILSRCQEARAEDDPGALSADDVHWNTYFQVVLRPNSRLSKSQQDIIAQDFAMVDGEAVVPVRQSLLYYFNKRLRLDVADQFDDPREAPVVVKNRAAFDAALAEAVR
ncbi:WYL domain-containing protein [Ancylobacter aquaticus]|nr:WYL domain-containing protein [Ancylobacter aquaticus]